MLGTRPFVFSAASNRAVPHCLYQPAPYSIGVLVHRGQQFFSTAFFRCANWRISSENKLYSFIFLLFVFFLACVPFARVACQGEERKEKNLGGALFIAHTPQVSFFLSHRLASPVDKKLYIYIHMKKQAFPFSPHWVGTIYFLIRPTREVTHIIARPEISAHITHSSQLFFVETVLPPTALQVDSGLGLHPLGRGGGAHRSTCTNRASKGLSLTIFRLTKFLYRNETDLARPWLVWICILVLFGFFFSLFFLHRGRVQQAVFGRNELFEHLHAPLVIYIVPRCAPLTSFAVQELCWLGDLKSQPWSLVASSLAV